MGEVVGWGGGGFTSTGSILVLFILLVIISCTVCGNFF
ncbi:sporulation protein YjcZ [Paenibacillus sp. N1-5-1-14]|nr:sporulation protein YjcZ [Paenibacillus radicibacter]MCR8641798.1 sporulation protein YjcZ [Paenibacillus radicibacter]